jgi:hypothetical protein
MKYTQEIVDKMVADYEAGVDVKEIAAKLDVVERSVIAKLSSLGVYKRKSYVNKRGEVPLKKEYYIERIAKMLDIHIELLESLEKTTKGALVLIEKQLAERIKE